MKKRKNIIKLVAVFLLLLLFLCSGSRGAVLTGEFLMNDKRDNDSLVVNSHGEWNGTFVSGSGFCYTIKNKSPDRFGRADKSILLTASQSDYIGIMDDNSEGIIPPDDFSLSFWFKADSLDTKNILISQYAEGLPGRFAVQAIGTALAIEIGDTEIQTVSEVVNPGIWYFCCIVRDSYSIKLYLTKFSLPFNKTAEIDYNGAGYDQELCSEPTIIGMASDSPWDGSLDCVRIWRGALHIQEMEALYNEEPYWIYDGGTKAMNCFDITALDSWDVVEDASNAKAGEIVWQELFDYDPENEWTPLYCDISQYSACTPIDFSMKGGYGLRIERTGGSSYCRVEDVFPDIPDVNTCYMRVYYYIPQWSGNISSIELTLSDSINNKRRMINTLPVTPGNHFVEFAHGGMNIKDTSGYAFDYTKINRIQFYIYGDIGAIVYLDAIAFVKNYHRPRILLTWDNGLPKMYSYVFPELEKRGIKGNFFVNRQREVEGEYFGVSGGMMTPEQLLEMEAAGNLIGNHTSEHKRANHNYSTRYSGRFPSFEMHEDIIQNAAYLKSIGIGIGRFFFAVPSSNAVPNAYSGYKAREELYRFWLQHAYCVIMGKFHKGADGIICGAEFTGHYTFPNPGTAVRIMYRDCVVFTFDSNYVTVGFCDLTSVPSQGAVLAGSGGGELVVKEYSTAADTIDGYLTGDWSAGETVTKESGSGTLSPSPATVVSVDSKGYMSVKEILERCKKHNEVFAPIWHSVGPREYTFDMTEDEFERMLDYAIKQGFEFVTYDDLMPWNQNRYSELPEDCITPMDMDFNNDCKVDFHDLSIFTQRWLKCNLEQ